MIAISITDKHTGKKLVVGVTKFHDRKRFCLYFEEGTIVQPLAYFTSEAAAHRMSAWLGQLAKEPA